MKHLFAISLFFLSLTAIGQTGVVRLEFESLLNSDIYKLIPLDKQGFLVFFETKDAVGQDSKNWFFVQYDKSFSEVWKANVPVLSGAEYQYFAKKDSLLFLFFYNNGRVKTDENNFQLLTINLVQKISYEIKGQLPPDSRFVKLRAANNQAYIAMNLKNDQAALFAVNPQLGLIHEFNISYPDQNYIEDLVYDPFDNQVLSIVSNFQSRRQNKMYLIALSENLNFAYDMEISPVVSGKYLNTARIFIADSADHFLLGTYNNLASKLPGQNEYFGIESAGVFATRLSQRKQAFMNYYNFVEFRNLRSGVSARDFYKLQKRKERESAEYSMNYELITHDIEMHDSTLVIMFEAYYPEFRSVSDISYDYWGRPVTHTYSVFDGYRFFNAILSGFNFNGELVWDNSLEINTAPSSVLNKKTSYFFDGKPAVIFYNDGVKIAYRISFKNAELEPFTLLDIETSEFGDKITATGQNKMIHWYDYTFLAFGYHTIRNNMLVEKNERTVFYINKVSLE